MQNQLWLRRAVADKSGELGLRSWVTYKKYSSGKVGKLPGLPGLERPDTK